MSEERIILAAKGVYYDTLPHSSLPTINTSLAASDWVAAGWTPVDYVNDGGVEIEMAHTRKMLRKLGSLTNHAAKTTEQGLKTISWEMDYDDEDAVTLSLPNPASISGGITGGGDEIYYAVAIHTDNAVWLARKVLATGKIKKGYKSDDFTKSPVEFECLEDDTNGVGTPNWARYKIA